MFGLKIFVRVQTFRRVPPVLPRNFCHPAFQETCAGQISQFLRCLAMLCIFIPPFIFVVVLYRRDKMFGMQQRLGIIDCYWVAGLHTQVYVIKQLFNHAVSLSRTYMLCIPISVAKVPAEKYCIEHAVLLL